MQNHITQAYKVGIVVPIYNVEQYLRECLDSILYQSHQNFEVVLINDGSTDTSLAIAKEYVARDKRFVLIDKDNGGLSNARNTGIYWFQSHFLQADKLAGGGIIINLYRYINIKTCILSHIKIGLLHLLTLIGFAFWILMIYGGIVFYKSV